MVLNGGLGGLKGAVKRGDGGDAAARPSRLKLSRSEEEAAAWVDERAAHPPTNRTSHMAHIYGLAQKQLVCHGADRQTLCGSVSRWRYAAVCIEENPPKRSSP